MTDTLKPCPFCGSNKIIIDEDDGITCPNCGAYIDRLSVEEDACLADIWNTRQIEDKKDKEIKRLREVLERISGEFEKDEISSFQINRWIYEALKGGEE